MCWGMTVDAAWEFFADEPPSVDRSTCCGRSGLGYLRLGQPATELSGGEAQRIKLATELQRTQRGNSLYILDEPTTGLHPADVERLITNSTAWSRRVTRSSWWNTTCASSRSDWVIDVGPGAGDEGGKIVAFGTPAELACSTKSRTARYLKEFERRLRVVGA